MILLGTIIYPSMMEYANRLNKTKGESVIITVPNPVFIPEIQFVSDLPKEESVSVEEVSSQEDDLSKFKFTKNLQIGDVDPEVKLLQEFLNSKGFLVSESGPGSPGKETELFGAGTKSALIKFQEANADYILKPYGLTLGTGFLGEGTRSFINN